MRKIDIDGKTFGLWTVIGPSDKPRYVKCKCACGTIQDVRKNALMRGDTLGCKTCAIANKRNGSEKRTQTMLERQKEKYIGQSINGWKILDIYKKEDVKGDNLYCKALCPVCGKECNIRLYKLRSTEKCVECTDNLAEPSKVIRDVCMVGDSSLIAVKSRMNGKVNKNSKTGYNGVTKVDGKYVANITFKKKTVYLGRYEDIDDAVAARKLADNLLYGSYLSEHDGWEKDLKDQLKELKQSERRTNEQSNNT